MDSERVEQLLLIHGSKLPPGSFDIVREKLYNCNDATRVSIVMSQLKDPTISDEQNAANLRKIILRYDGSLKNIRSLCPNCLKLF